jgi:RNA polymerase sigma factor (sigma-70 family)
LRINETTITIRGNVKTGLKKMKHQPKNTFKTDKDLILSCVYGNREAREALVERYSEFVYRTVQYTFKKRNFPCNRSDFEDLHATVFVKLLEKGCRRLSQYKGQNGCSLLSWIKLITVRTVKDHINKFHKDALSHRERVLPLEAFGDLQLKAAGPQELIEHAEQYRLIEAGMEGLVSRDRIFLQLHFFKGHSIGEVAKYLKLSDNAAYSVKHRAVNRLKSAVHNRQKMDVPECNIC